MTSKVFDTIIVGAGISGLACARRLQQFNEDFLVVSKDIGGRILISDDGLVNYGAFFVCSDYSNVLKYVKIKSRIKLSDFCFHNNNKIYVLFETKFLAYLFQFMKVIRILYKFRKSLRKFRMDTEAISQKKAIEGDSFLYKLYLKNANDFINELKIQSGTDTYLSKGLYSTTFSKTSEMNAFSFLQFLLPLITPIYTFSFEKEKMMEPIKDKTIIGGVNDIQYKNGYYKIKVDSTLLVAKNIVFATPISWSKYYANVKKTNKSVSTYMFHVKGIPKDIVTRKSYQLFSPLGTEQAIADLKDGTYLFYNKDNYPPLKKYFSKFKVISYHFWNPAGTINGHTLIESNRGNNMYLIGDFNVAGLEESYVSGLYAANQIIQSH